MESVKSGPHRKTYQIITSVTTWDTEEMLKLLMSNTGHGGLNESYTGYGGLNEIYLAWAHVFENLIPMVLIGEVMNYPNYCFIVVKRCHYHRNL